jgi:hypothetical protein
MMQLPKSSHIPAPMNTGWTPISPGHLGKPANGVTDPDPTHKFRDTLGVTLSLSFLIQQLV